MSITLTDKLLSSNAAKLYYSLISSIRYTDLYTLAKQVKLNTNEAILATKELEDLQLIETKIQIRKNKR